MNIDEILLRIGFNKAKERDYVVYSIGPDKSKSLNYYTFRFDKGNWNIRFSPDKDKGFSLKTAGMTFRSNGTLEPIYDFIKFHFGDLLRENLINDILE